MFKMKNTYLLLLFIFSWSCRGTDTVNDFNGGFEVKSPLRNEPSGWFATRVPQTKDFETDNMRHIISYSVFENSFECKIYKEQFYDY